MPSKPAEYVRPASTPFVAPLLGHVNVALSDTTSPELHAYLKASAQHGVERALIEFAARVCYRSTGKMLTAPNFVSNVLSSGHLSVAEHPGIMFSKRALMGYRWESGMRYKTLSAMYEINRFFVETRNHVAGNLRSWLEVVGELRYNPSFETFLAVLPEAFDAESLLSTIDVHKAGVSVPVYVPSYEGDSEERHTSHLLYAHTGNLYHRNNGRNTRKHNLWLRYTFLVDGVSRNLTHQLARHRGASISQESQRYVDASSARFVLPPNVNDAQRQRMERAYQDSVAAYIELRASGLRKEDARFVLPGAARTRLVVSFDHRELVHFLKLRCAKDAQWEIRRLARTMAQQALMVSPTPELTQLVKEHEIDGFDS